MQNKEKILIIIWDNASHHPEIKTFPHHVHEGDDQILHFDRCEPEYPEKKGKILLGNLDPNTDRTIALYLDPKEQMSTAASFIKMPTAG